MAVYVFSLLAGFLPNGVDNAQGGRASYFRKLKVPVKYIYTDVIYEPYLSRYVDAGILEDEMISAHQFFTDQPSLAGKIEARLLAEQLMVQLNGVQLRENEKEFNIIGDTGRIACVLKRSDGIYVELVKYYEQERLLMQDIYTDHVLYTNYFITAVNENHAAYAKLVRRGFKNKDGSSAFDILYDRDGNERFVFPDGWNGTKAQFLDRFIEKLNLSNRDVIIIDRPSHPDYTQALFRRSGGAKICIFLHSMHYMEQNEDPSSIGLNYEYYYWFSQSEKIYAFIVSTEEQKYDLLEKLNEFRCHVPEIAVIPASGLKQLRYPVEDRKPFSILSVSRLDQRKRIDWLIRSVVLAHEQVPGIQLDVYGNGTDQYTHEMKELISELQAENYIHLKGYCDVSDVYRDYEVYLATSLWETLGLSLMEAVGSGNVMIGLDARYGNRLFIEDKVNGLRIPFSLDAVEDIKLESQLIQSLADAIIYVFTHEEELQKMSCNSYRIAQQFLNTVIEDKWLQFMEGMITT